MFLQTWVPTSMTAWCISALARELVDKIALGRISDWMCDRRSSVSGSIVWYSSSIPILRLGRFICLPLGSALWSLHGFDGLRCRFCLDSCRAAAQKGAPPVFRHFAGMFFGFADRQLDRKSVGEGNRVALG